jgi:CRISPR/Cas system-associated exonuclease Cas4 (RecB family)
MTWGTFITVPGAPPAEPTSLPKIQAWSYSRLAKWEKCPKSAYYAFILRMAEPKSPAMQRGTDAHEEAANLLLGRECIPVVLTADWQHRLRTIRDIYGTDVEAELQQGFNNQWEPTGWFGDDTWCRVVFDGLVIQQGAYPIRVFEHKTGKVRAEHISQAGLYAVAAHALMPGRDVEVTINYLDNAVPGPQAVAIYPFKAKDIPALRDKWNARVAPMLNDTEYPATPGSHCRWCSYSSKNGGDCDRG